MREIKFRVWDKHLNQMLHTTDLEWYDDSFGFRLDKHIEDIEYNLMQYTGLIDKNGKEIYEGDVIQFYSLSADGIVQGAVIYHFGIFRIGNYMLVNHYNRCEVIGNIYENPELLD